MEDFEVNNMSKESNIASNRKMYFTKLRSFVKKRHDVFIEPEIHHAADRKRVETVDLFLKAFFSLLTNFHIHSTSPSTSTN